MNIYLEGVHLEYDEIIQLYITQKVKMICIHYVEKHTEKEALVGIKRMKWLRVKNAKNFLIIINKNYVKN